MMYRFDEYFERKINEEEKMDLNSALWDLAVIFLSTREIRHRMKKIKTYIYFQENQNISDVRRACVFKSDYDHCHLVCKEKSFEKDQRRYLLPGEIFQLHSSDFYYPHEIENVVYSGTCDVDHAEYNKEVVRLEKIILNGNEKEAEEAESQHDKLYNRRYSINKVEMTFSTEILGNNFDIKYLNTELQETLQTYKLNVEDFLEKNPELNFHVMFKEIRRVYDDVINKIGINFGLHVKDEITNLFQTLVDPMFSILFIDFAKNYFKENNFSKSDKSEYIKLVSEFLLAMKENINPAMWSLFQ
jgi:hypothetical protein